jgi:hypothetical protein
MEYGVQSELSIGVHKWTEGKLVFAFFLPLTVVQNMYRGNPSDHMNCELVLYSNNAAVYKGFSITKNISIFKLYKNVIAATSFFVDSIDDITIHVEQRKNYYKTIAKAFANFRFLVSSDRKTYFDTCVCRGDSGHDNIITYKQDLNITLNDMLEAYGLTKDASKNELTDTLKNLNAIVNETSSISSTIATTSTLLNIMLKHKDAASTPLYKILRYILNLMLYSLRYSSIPLFELIPNDKMFYEKLSFLCSDPSNRKTLVSFKELSIGIKTCDTKTITDVTEQLVEHGMKDVANTLLRNFVSRISSLNVWKCAVKMLKEESDASITLFLDNCKVARMSKLEDLDQHTLRELLERWSTFDSESYRELYARAYRSNLHRDIVRLMASFLRNTSMPIMKYK